jgi:hypothetical protein
MRARREPALIVLKGHQSGAGKAATVVRIIRQSIAIDRRVFHLMNVTVQEAVDNLLPISLDETRLQSQFHVDVGPFHPAGTQS